jgi:hypothetical protein
VKAPGPIHHIFTLDTHDPKTPVRFDGVRHVPLVYPLALSSGGADISYQIVGEYNVKILRISDHRPDEPPYFLLDSLPQRRASLVPLTYGERRILGSDITEKSLLDRLRWQRLWNGECFRVSGMMHYSSKLGVGCLAERGRETKACTGWKFAYFPATKKPFGDIWHEYSADVWICFSICPDCGTIYAYNECT